jgi:hypothetical protein
LHGGGLNRLVEFDILVLSNQNDTTFTLPLWMCGLSAGARLILLIL